MAERAYQTSDIRRQISDVRPILSYDPFFDITAYQALQSSKNVITFPEFQRRKTQLETRIRHNLETNLGERFNVEISRVEYQLENDQVFSPEHDEPFWEVLRRGQLYRQKCGSTEVVREKAEVEGFATLSRILLDCQGESLLEKRVIIIVPRGGPDSSYQHNFFDVYQKQEDGSVLMSRYTSKLSWEELWQVAKRLEPTLPDPIKLTDASFLSHPIVTDKATDELLELFSPQEKTMSCQEYQNLIEACTPLINAYIENPNYRTYNATLNFADAIIRETPTPEVKSPYTSGVKYPAILPVEQTINYYGNLPVRTVMTGCGAQGDSMSMVNGQWSMVNFSPYSVSEFGRKSACAECGGTGNHFHCPGCSGQIESGRGITVCPHCHLSKEQAGSRC